MRAAWIWALSLAGVLLVGRGTASAVNCDQVKRYAATGRSAEEIADTMIADVGEVKKCLAAEKKEDGKKPAPPAEGATEKK